MKPCRDCGQMAAPSARSCPHCGILNPVLQWVALPDGAHLTHREPVKAGAVADPFAIFGASTSNTAALAGATYQMQARAASREGLGGTVAAIADDDDAIEAINVVAVRFFYVAGLSFVFGYLVRDMMGAYWYADAVILGALAFALKQMHSRVAAGLLLAFSVFTVLSQVILLTQGEVFIGRIIIWGYITAMAYRALMGCIALHKKRQLATA